MKLTARNALGALVIASPFIVIFIISSAMLGFDVAGQVFLATAAIIAFVSGTFWLGMYLIEGDPQ